MKYSKILIEGFDKLGLSYNQLQLKKFSLYLELFIRENQIKNLSSIREEKDILIKHFLDSLSGINSIKEYYKSDKQILDIGTGGGFPGVPLKIIKPKWKIDLSEVNKKKIEFLNNLLGILEINDCKIIDSSQEKIPKEYDIIISRAFGKFDMNISEAIKYLKKNGIIILYKARKDKIEDDIKKSKLLKKKKIIHIKTKKLNIPYIEAERHLVILKSLYKVS